MEKRFHSPRPQPPQGFTLVEAALALVVTGLVLGAIFPAIQTMRTTQAAAVTQTNLQTLLRATSAYTIAHGCVPCPSPSTKTANYGLGWVRGDMSATRAFCGTCSTPEGIPPFASLGLSQATAKDGWGHWIRMHVDPALTSTTIVPPWTACTSSDSQTTCPTGSSAKGLCASGLSTTAAPLVKTQYGQSAATSALAAVVFLSHGANGFGAWRDASTATIAFPAGELACASGGVEACNASASGTFYATPFSNDPSNPFDDLLAYLGRNALISLLGTGACSTSWGAQ